jgi:type I restriction enzyme R subunit
MQSVLSSASRIDQVVNDIVFDFETRPRLSNARGTAILVASSIYEACRYFERFQSTPFRGRCAVVTSYNPNATDITTEDTGANSDTDKEFIYRTYTELLKNVDAAPGKTKTETYEDRSKDLFKREPANMKLLVVVDKLLTGFDAPSCTYLYIDKSMQDHALFQAICRTNRLDGDDKDFGYVVDYKDLFKKVEKAISVYSSELDHSAPGADPGVLMNERLSKSRERLDAALEAYALLLEPVEPPRDEQAHIRYFCGNTEIPTDLAERAPRREALYKAVASLVRAYANLADELEAAGYTQAETTRLKARQKEAAELREIVRRASGETLDLKAYEADMRHLIDTYIQADEPRKVSPFDALPLLELIERLGIQNAIDRMPKGVRGSRASVAETIENNVRSKIVRERLSDPAFYDQMSALLAKIIAERNARALEYEAYLDRIAELARQVQAGQADETPDTLNTPGRRALYNNLGQDEALAVRIDETVKAVRPDAWRGMQAKENIIKAALYGVLQDQGEVERIFAIVAQQAEY